MTIILSVIVTNIRPLQSGDYSPAIFINECHLGVIIMSSSQQVNNINQPLEISAISSPEQSSRSPSGPDLDQPPILKRERPLELNGTSRYSSPPSSDDDDSGYPADSSSSR